MTTGRPVAALALHAADIRVRGAARKLKAVNGTATGPEEGQKR